LCTFTLTCSLCFGLANSTTKIENANLYRHYNEVDDDVIDVSHIDNLCPMLHVDTHTTLSHNINTTSNTLHNPIFLWNVCAVISSSISARNAFFDALNLTSPLCQFCESYLRISSMS
jgi:hypothetical protein